MKNRKGYCVNMVKIANYLYRRYMVYALLLGIAAIFVVLFSYSTSPLYPNYYGLDYGGDSAQFLTVGKAWSEGLIPYRDTFDHKGPIIFFIDMLGYSIFNSKSGIAFFQIISMFFFCLSIYKISTLWKPSRVYGLLSIISTLFILKIDYLNGNTVEEYCLSFIGFSIYFQLSFLNKSSDGRKSHPSKYAFFYGVTLAIGLMTRLTNVLPICLGVLVITCLLIYRKNFVNLFQNVGGFIAGFLVLFLPFYLYFVFQGAAEEFWFAVLGFNMEYNAGMKAWLYKATANDITNFIKDFLPWFLCAFSVYPAFRRNKAIAALYFLWTVAEFYLFCSGSLFAQYSIIAIPQVALFLNEIMLYNRQYNESNSIIRMVGLAFLVVVCYNVAYQMVPLAADKYQAAKDPPIKQYQLLIDKIPEEDRNFFVAYGGNSLKDIYLVENLLPCYKYFVIQPWHSNFSEAVRQDVHTTFAQCKAKWILTEGSTEIIQDILDAKYEVAGVAEEYTLYQLVS